VLAETELGAMTEVAISTSSLSSVATVCFSREKRKITSQLRIRFAEYVPTKRCYYLVWFIFLRILQPTTAVSIKAVFPFPLKTVQWKFQEFLLFKATAVV